MRKSYNKSKNRIIIAVFSLISLLVVSGYSDIMMGINASVYATEKVTDNVSGKEMTTSSEQEAQVSSKDESETESESEIIPDQESEIESEVVAETSPELETCTETETESSYVVYEDDSTVTKIVNYDDYTASGSQNEDEMHGYAFIADSEAEAKSLCDKIGANFLSYEYGVAEIESYFIAEENRNVDGYVICPIYEYDISIEEDEAQSTATGQQWHRDILETDKAWEVAKGNGVVIAMIDSGVAYDHPALSGNIYKVANTIDESYYTDGTLYVGDSGREYDYVGHGTHVAGIMAANSSNIIGIAPEARIYSIKSVEYKKSRSGTKGNSSWTAKAINLAIEENVDIINMSIGGLTSVDRLIEAALADAYDKGIILVAAAGNGSLSNIHYPGMSQYTYAITNGYESADKGLVFSSSSNYGTGVTFIAPGTSILSTDNTGGFTLKSGTSMATPVVSGVFALLKSKYPSKSRQEIYKALEETALDLGPEGYDTKYGYGMVRPVEALEKLAEGEPTPSVTPTDEPDPSGTPTKRPTKTPVSEPEEEDDSSDNSSNEDNSEETTVVAPVFSKVERPQGVAISGELQLQTPVLQAPAVVSPKAPATDPSEALEGDNGDKPVGTEEPLEKEEDVIDDDESMDGIDENNPNQDTIDNSDDKNSSGTVTDESQLSKKGLFDRLSEMSMPKKVGLSVAGIAILAVAGLIIFVLFKRRKKE